MTFVLRSRSRCAEIRVRAPTDRRLTSRIDRRRQSYMHCALCKVCTVYQVINTSVGINYTFTHLEPRKIRTKFRCQPAIYQWDRVFNNGLAPLVRGLHSALTTSQAHQRGLNTAKSACDPDIHFHFAFDRTENRGERQNESAAGCK
jgi:hypothetical protein